jgi:transcription initiation factor TFIIIB Brf1 subunit/transcription initiation factor TFIIB
MSSNKTIHTTSLKKQVYIACGRCDQPQTVDEIMKKMESTPDRIQVLRRLNVLADEKKVQKLNDGEKITYAFIG